MSNNELFCSEEWQKLTNIALATTNAALEDDVQQRSSLYLKLESYIVGLFVKFGRDPALLEVLADYTLDKAKAIELYNEAISTLEAKGDDASSVRLDLSLAMHSQGDAFQMIEDVMAGIDLRKLDEHELYVYRDLVAKLEKPRKT